MITVVLADDAGELRRLLRLLLERTGEFSVVAEAANGDEAVAACIEHVPDLVLLDLSMPVRSGLDALEELAALTRVVVLSGFSSGEVIDQCLARGACAYVEKGRSMEDVAVVLKELHVPRG